jgi:alpha-galactosidase
MSTPAPPVAQTFTLNSPAPAGGTTVILSRDPRGLPLVAWVGVLGAGADPVDVATAIGAAVAPTSSQALMSRAVPLLPQVSQSWLGRPGLVGHRLGADVVAGRDWSTALRELTVDATEHAVVIEASDEGAQLALRTELQALPGGGLRMRHQLTNLAHDPYLVESLDVVVPLPDRVGETLDMTGRWAFERSPQRRPIADGVWLREDRSGRPGFDSPTVLVAGTTGFGFGHGEVWGLHLAWSGNARHFVQRQPSGLVTMGAGELLLAGEVVLGQGACYITPWVHIGASTVGLDELAAQNHSYLRSLSAHPTLPSPVVCNVWEAVYFDHDLAKLRELADLAAGVGVERFVLDDGWFGSRRDDGSGLGDWVVSDEVWPLGLSPLADYVRDRGMQFGLWFEPEMVNPDSDLYRAHPEWILNVSGREPGLLRNQLVLDLGRPEVRDYLFGQMDAVLSKYPIDYVKWDHNRVLVDAASSARADTAGVHAQTLGFYDLLDRLRSAHPTVEWESCASGGARIDLGVLERAERVWTSDMTDALARQMIQRWTGQLVAPEYLGAHVSAPQNHQTGRCFTLDFRAATAFFADFGVEWDISSATPTERARLAQWISAYKEHRDVLHSGRVVRMDSTDDAIWMYGVIATDRCEAVVAYVQLDETVRDPLPLLVTGLEPSRRYTARQLVPTDESLDSQHGLGPWRGEGMTLSGAVLATVGLPGALRRPLSALVVHLVAD